MNKIMPFLKDLVSNNELAWMHANKPAYLAAKREFTELVQTLIARVSAFDPSVAMLRAEDIQFRLNRDTRFSHDKSPYNPAFRAHISAGGKSPVPAGYYICIKPGASFLGGGLFMVMPEAVTRMRAYLPNHADALLDILNAPAFKPFTLQGEKLKNVPKGFAPDHPMAEYLKHKSWYIQIGMPDERIYDVDWITDMFRRIKPFNDFLNTALDGLEWQCRNSR